MDPHIKKKKGYQLASDRDSIFPRKNILKDVGYTEMPNFSGEKEKPKSSQLGIKLALTLSLITIGVGTVIYKNEVKKPIFTKSLHKRPVISPTALTGYFLEAYKI